MYDWFVRLRNDKVISAAVRSGAIVSSLFPSNVRERLYREAEEKQSQTKQLDMGGSGVKHWLSAENMDANLGGGAEEGSFIPYRAKPIADLFPETTILFADIGTLSSIAVLL